MPRRKDSKGLSVQFHSAGGELGDNEALEKVRGELRHEARRIKINDKLAMEGAASIVPDVHSLVSNAYFIIDSELRTLRQVSSTSYGLDKNQAANFASIVRSIQTLSNVESQLKDQNALEALPDDELRKKASEAFLKLDGRIQRTMKEEAGIMATRRAKEAYAKSGDGDG
jgi:hypothetical protein